MSVRWRVVGMVLGVGLVVGAPALVAPAPGVAAVVARRVVTRPAVARPAVAAPAAVEDAPTDGLATDENQACGTTAGVSCSRLSIGGIGGTVLNAGGQLATGNIPGSVGTLVGGAASTVISSATTAISLAAIGFWVAGGAQGVLHDAAAALGATTSPQLRSTWFSSTYLRMAAIAAVLTLPFLFAAAVQALIRSDVALLAKATFGYLPLAMLAIGIAAPLTTLVLTACDQLCSFISSAAGNESAHFLEQAGLTASGLSALTGSPFLVFLVGLFIIVTAFALWVELLLREAAVYVIVLMLPLAFAAFVWPARRIWAIRAVELLVALILSKFTIVAVLSLGGAAISASGSLTGLMAGAVLILLATFSPWVLMRLIPLAELATSAVEPMRGGLRTARGEALRAIGHAGTLDEGWMTRAAAMKREADAGMRDTARPPAPPATADPEREPPVTPKADASGPPEDQPPQPSVDENSSGERILEFDRKHIGSTPAWPNEDAE